MVKYIPHRKGSPSEKQARATKLVLEQAEVP